jgi:AraC-type DNA-binding domain-containing proteins
MKYTLICFLCCLMTGMAFGTDTLPVQGDSLMHYLPKRQTAGDDSIRMSKFEEVRYFNRDSLFIRYADEGLEAVEEEFSYYCDDILSPLSDHERKEELEKVRRTITGVKKRSLLLEMDYIEAIALPDSTDEQKKYQWQQLNEVIEKARKEKKFRIELRALSFLFLRLIMNEEYSKAFFYARHSIERLESIDKPDYPEATTLWYNIGEAYYRFRDYDRFLYCMKKAVREKSNSFYNRSNLQARNTLGVYYRNMGDLDEADRWFRSMLESPDRVKYRPMYDCIATSNIAGNMSARGRYAEALSLFESVLPVAVNDKDYPFASGIIIGMGECYIASGELEKTKEMIDSAQFFINLDYHQYRYMTLYPLMSRYYTLKGDYKTAGAYNDSTIVVNRRYEDVFNALYILRAEQEAFDAELRNKNESIRMQQVAIRGSVAVLLTLFSLLIIILYLYRKKNRALQILVEQSRKWAESAGELSVFTSGTDADIEDIAVMKSVKELIEKQRLYCDPMLSVEMLSDKLNLHRNQISKAVNTTQNKNFKTYINEYRLQETIRMLSDPQFNDLTIDQILFECGFNNRQTFYPLFKAKTGVSPKHFRIYQ